MTHLNQVLVLPPAHYVLNTEMDLISYMVKIHSMFSDSYCVFKGKLHTSSL